MERIQIYELTVSEKAKFAAVLKYYFPELGTDEEMDAGEILDELGFIFDALKENY